MRIHFGLVAVGGAALCCHPYDLCTELIAREMGGEEMVRARRVRLPS
jgi:hypothetical protein